MGNSAYWGDLYSYGIVDTEGQTYYIKWTGKSNKLIPHQFLESEFDVEEFQDAIKRQGKLVQHGIFPVYRVCGKTVILGHNSITIH